MLNAFRNIVFRLMFGGNEVDTMLAMLWAQKIINEKKDLRRSSEVAERAGQGSPRREWHGTSCDGVSRRNTSHRIGGNFYEKHI